MYKLQKSRIKKIIFALTTIILITSILTGCSNGYANYYVDTDTQLLKFEQNYDFLRKKPSYEFDDSELNRKIDLIKETNYKTHNKEFNEYNISNIIKEELITILDKDFSLKEIDNEIDYAWYSNGKVNSKLLSEVLIENTKAAGIAVNNNTLLSANAISKNLEAYLNTLKSLGINYNEKNLLDKINSLYFDTTNDNNVYASFINGGISVNYETSNTSNDIFVSKILHETGHAILNCNTKSELINKVGISIQNNDNSYNTLEFTFIEEFTVDDLASKTILSKRTSDYNEELEKITMISKSTGYSIEEIEKRFFEGDILKFMNMFESEVRDYYKIASIMHAIDLSCSCGQANDKGFSNVKRFKNDCDSYARCELFKNGCIRILKQGDNIEEKINDLYTNLSMNKFVSYDRNSKSNKKFNNFCKQIYNICGIEFHKI